MTLRRRLALFLLAAALAPVVGVGFAMLAWLERDLGRRTTAEHLARAQAGAAAVAAELAELEVTLGALTDAWRPDRLGEAELEGLLHVLARQLPESDASAIVDAAGSTRAVLAGDGSRQATDAFLAAVGQAADAPEGRLVLTAYGEAGDARLAAVRPVAAAAGGRWLVAARLAPAALREGLDAAVPEGGAAWLLDGERVLLGSAGAGPIPKAAREELRGRLDPARAGAVEGRTTLAAFAPLGDGTGWGVLVAVPVEIARAGLAGMRRGVVAASLAVAAAVLLLSFLLSRRTTAGIARLDAAARALGAGELSVRLPAEGRDEIAEVSRTFNGMAAELASSRQKLERWNEELVAEVAARTRALEEAQARLVEVRKLAAVGQLGAGVAHEINNPLTGILGNAQLLLEQLPAGAEGREPLERIEALARRCREITQTLLRFGEQRAEPSLRPLDLNGVVREALTLGEGQVREAGVALELELAEPGPRVNGDPGQLAQVVLHLLSNARTACAGKAGAAVRIATRSAGRQVELEVADGGKGIAPEHLPHVFEPFFTTKDEWSNVGLGLSVSFRIVSEHGGTLRAESRQGEGSRFVVALPALPAAG